MHTETLSQELGQIYRHRFSDEDEGELKKVWETLVEDYFQKWIHPNDAVLDLGSGRCVFINQVRARKKYAFDANAAMEKYAGQDVQFILGEDLDTAQIDEPLDKVFVSNFLEHLDSSSAVLKILRSIHRRLKPTGQVIILQPNFSLVGPKYFDFIDHKVILTEASLREALELTGYQVDYLKKRFLPYTSKSKLPKAQWMVKLYLKFPPAQLLLGKQTLVVASRSHKH